MDYTTRRMVPADARAVAEVHVRVWREAYAGVFPDDFLAALDVDRYEAGWTRMLGNTEDEEVRVVGVTDSDAVVGFGVAGPGREDDAPTDWELYALNLIADVHGTGLADRMMADLVDGRAAYLWVAEQNPRARAFYAKHGFAPDGGRRVLEQVHAQELRLSRPSG